MKLTAKEAEVRYGKIENGKWANEAQWCVVFKTPDWFAKQVVNTNTGKSCTKIYMNKDMVPMFQKALDLLVQRGCSGELKTVDGCYNIRMVRGSMSATSYHSWAAAIDLNAAENPLGGPVKFSKEFLQCFKDAGFTLGAEFSRVDGQHFSLGG